MNETITFANQFETGNGQTIGYTYVPFISSYNPRLYLQVGYGVATDLMSTLNEMSNWGGVDKIMYLGNSQNMLMRYFWFGLLRITLQTTK